MSEELDAREQRMDAAVQEWFALSNAGDRAEASQVLNEFFLELLFRKDMTGEAVGDLFAQARDRIKGRQVA